MNILFVTHDIDSGGAARSLSILVKELSLRHSIAILTLIDPVPHKNTLAYYKALNVPLYSFRWGWLPVSFVGCSEQPALYKELCLQNQKYLQDISALGESFDCICFNSYAPTSLAPYFPGKPKVLIAREILVPSSPQFAESASLLKTHINKAIAIGPREAQQLHALKIPYEIIFNTSAQQPKFVPFPHAPPLRMGMFAQLLPIKGFTLLLEAFTQYANILTQLNVHLHFFGITIPSEASDALLNYAAQHALSEWIHPEGWITSVEESMAQMHWIIRPDCTGSPWGRDIIEAMSIGRPVLAAGEEDVFVKSGETGYLFPPMNTHILGKLLIHIAQNPQQMHSLGKNAFTFAQKHFSPSVNAQKIEQILQAVSQPQDHVFASNAL